MLDPAAPRFSWTTPARLAGEFGDAAGAFGDAVRRRRGPWMALWCATAGGVGTPREVLQRETAALRRSSARWARPSGAGPTRAWNAALLQLGRRSLRAGRRATADGELSVPADFAYGRAKLEQEAEVLRWARETPRGLPASWPG